MQSAHSSTINDASVTLDGPGWARLRSPDEVADALIELFDDRGGTHIDQGVTQTEHALQTASVAMASGGEDTMVVAALLHDVGHLLLDEHLDNEEFLAADLRHEQIGARFLSRWFEPAVVEPIRFHVLAKRWLVTTDPPYAQLLSTSARRSLALQGGPIGDEDRERLLGSVHFEAALELRRCDDMARTPGAPTPTLGTLRSVVVDVLRRSQQIS